MGELIPYLAVVAVLVAGLFTFRQCSNSDHQAGNGFTTICVEGHEYLSKNEGNSYRGFLAIKLSDDGKPIKCRR